MKKAEKEWEFEEEDFESLDNEPEENEEEFGEVEPELPDIWLPEESGEVLEGEIIEIGDMTWGLAAIVKMKSGETIQTPAHKLLQSRLKKLDHGDYIRIVYKGTMRTKGGRKAEDYSVYKRRKAGEKGGEKGGETKDYRIYIKRRE